MYLHLLDQFPMTSTTAIADALLAIQERIGEIICNYETASLMETRLAVRFQINNCKALLDQVLEINASDRLSQSVCQQYVGILNNNLRILTNLENNCISNQNGIEIANKLDMNENPWFDPNKGPAKQLVRGNPVLEKAMSFSGPPPVYTPSYHTYVIRSWDGERYYKLQIISWYDANVQIGDEGGRISYYLDELK